MRIRRSKGLWICLLLCLLAAAASGGMFGCAYKPPPPDIITVVNRTKSFLDIKFRDQIVTTKLKSGETFDINTYFFHDGQRMSIIATGRDADGKYVGSDIQHFRATSSHYRRHGYYHSYYRGYSYRRYPEQIVCEVKKLQPPD